MNPQRYRTVVKRYHVRRREIQVLVASLATAIVLAMGFYFGQRAAYSGMGISPASYREMKAAIPLKEQQIEQLEHTLDVSRARMEVDRAALEMVRRDIAAHKEQLMDLEESLRFYQGLMAPEELAKGLVLRPIELIATAAENRFVFRIVAQQEARKHSLLKGTLSVKVEGVVGDEALSFPLSALSEDIGDENLVLRFRYFQAIEGELVLPPDFQPRAVSMVAKTSAPQKLEVRELFPWSVQEKFSYAGK